MMPLQTTEKRPGAPLALLGVACAVGVSTNYYNQPLLLKMAQTYGVSAGQAGFVAVATQLGYASGMLVFVPMGDLLERRGLMTRMYAGVALALVLLAAAPTFSLLLLLSAAAGMLASVTHVALPIAPDLAPPEQRGRAIGAVMTGLLLGILLARSFAGWVSELALQQARLPGTPHGIRGWRLVFLLAAAMNLAFVPLLRRRMPVLPPKSTLSYVEAMRSLWTLFRTQPLLRESGTVGALAFGAFSCFWTTLAFMLDRHHGLGPAVAGSFGLVGAAGAAIAPLAGRLADRHGPRWVISCGLGLFCAAFVVLWCGEALRVGLAAHMVALTLGVLLLDAGAQMTQVGNQTRVFGLDPGARSRLNTVYMVMYFSGAATGSALGTLAWDRWQWNGVCGLALGFLTLAVVRQATGHSRGGGRPIGDVAVAREMAPL